MNSLRRTCMGFTGSFSFGRCNPLLATSFAVALLKAPFCHQKRGFKAIKRVKNASLLHDHGLLAWSDPKVPFINRDTLRKVARHPSGAQEGLDDRNNNDDGKHVRDELPKILDHDNEPQVSCFCRVVWGRGEKSSPSPIRLFQFLLNMSCPILHIGRELNLLHFLLQPL